MASEKLQTYIDNEKMGGISTLIYKNGETAYSENFGYLNLNEKIPMDETAIFRIFSMTKPITAIALMTLFDEGKFKLDDKVSKYIPEFEGAMVYNAETKTLEPQIDELSIRHLLTHIQGSLMVGIKKLISIRCIALVVQAAGTELLAKR